MNAADLAPSYDLVVIGGGPAGLAAAALAARAGVQTVLFDENPGVGGQIYRGITATPVRDRAILGDDYWAGAALAAEAKASGATIVNGATVWSLDPTRLVGVSIAGQARLIQARRVIIATGSLERPFPIPGWTLPGVMTAGAAQTALKAQGLVPTGRTVMAGAGPLLWLLAAQLLRAGARIEAILDTTPRVNWLRAAMHLPDFALSPYWSKGLALLREVKAKVPVIARRQRRGARQGQARRGRVRHVRRRAADEGRPAAAASGRRAEREPRARGRRRASLERSPALLRAGGRRRFRRPPFPASPSRATGRASPAVRRRRSADGSRRIAAVRR